MNDTQQPKRDDAVTTTIRVMPNSGHHYFFIPFKKDFLAAHGGPQGELTKRCRKNQSPWSPCPTVDSSEPARWIRYRFGYQGQRSNVGIWIAVESNLGTVRRGTVLKVSEVTTPPPADQQPTTPFRYASEATFKQATSGSDVFAIQLPTSSATDKEEDARLLLEIVWVQAPSAPIDVDIIVDFGNTRTVVLALENNPEMAKNGRLSAICKNILFLPRGVEYPEPRQLDPRDMKRASITDSWFLLQEPQFSEWDYPPHQNEKTPFFTVKEYVEEKETVIEKGTFSSKKVEKLHHYCVERIPQMFVEISPVLMGAEAKELFNNIDLTPGLNVSMSSPKRYLWDHESFGDRGGQLLWNLNENPWTQYRPKDRQNLLHGQICRYMYPDGHFWEISEPPFLDKDELQRPHCFPERPHYPRCCAMVWSALSIIENAYRQITSSSWRKGNNEYVNRRLRNIHVTFPSGWIAQEKLYYKQAWQQAVNIFTLAHMENQTPIGQSRGCDGQPELIVKLDEAVASQLPFVYSEIRRLGNANLWIQLYGRRCTAAQAASNSAAEYRNWKTRVMTIDIGGGTSDTTVVEYRNDVPDSGVSLRYRVLFRDCCSFAGDAVTKAIIEKVLLPSLLEARAIDLDSEEADIIDRVIKGPHNTQASRAMWQRITTLFFLPIVRQWLSDAVTFQDTGAIFREKDGTHFRTNRDCGVDDLVINEFNAILRDAGIAANVADAEDRLSYDPALINECIREELTIGLEPLGKFVSAYDVDLVTLSGKISEMPIVFELLCEYLPIRPQRIVRMKNFLAGDWYPMAEDGRHIDDAKTVTSVGAALFAASESKLLGASWSIIEDRQEVEPIRNFWGVMRKGKGFGTILLSNEDESNKQNVCEIAGESYYGHLMTLESYIGRQKYYSKYSTPEQQYQLHWIGDPQEAPRAALAVCIQRRINEENDDDIELVNVQTTDPMDAQCDMSKVKLMLKTLPPEGFWMEEAMFNIYR